MLVECYFHGAFETCTTDQALADISINSFSLLINSEATNPSAPATMHRMYALPIALTMPSSTRCLTPSDTVWNTVLLAPANAARMSLGVKLSPSRAVATYECPIFWKIADVIVSAIADDPICAVLMNPMASGIR